MAIPGLSRNTYPVLLDEAVRRNRRRLVGVTAVAAINLWFVFGLLITVLVVPYVIRGSRGAPGALLPLSALASFTVSALVTAWILGGRLRSVAGRTVDELGAGPVVGRKARMVENLVDGLAIAAGTPPVAVALLHDDAPNALAVGRRPSETTIVITTAMLDLLTRDEIEAVLAAEICAIRRLDTAMQTVALACAAGGVGAYRGATEDGTGPRAWFVMALTWPSMKLARSLGRSMLRTADFGADAMAITLTRHPEALTRALRKLANDDRVVMAGDYLCAPLWFKPVPLALDAPTHAVANQFDAPTLEERAARLP